MNALSMHPLLPVTTALLAPHPRRVYLTCTDLDRAARAADVDDPRDAALLDLDGETRDHDHDEFVDPRDGCYCRRTDQVRGRSYGDGEWEMDDVDLGPADHCSIPLVQPVGKSTAVSLCCRCGEAFQNAVDMNMTDVYGAGIELFDDEGHVAAKRLTERVLVAAVIRKLRRIGYRYDRRNMEWRKR